MQLQGHTFLVTGGGSGLGAACVRTFVGGGRQRGLADVNPQTGEQLAAELGEHARFVKTDVTERAERAKRGDLAREAFGGLHGAINCAGIGIAAACGRQESGPHPLDVFTKVIQVNLIGTFNVIRLAAAGDGRRGAERGRRASAA